MPVAGAMDLCKVAGSVLQTCRFSMFADFHAESVFYLHFYHIKVIFLDLIATRTYPYDLVSFINNSIPDRFLCS